jgi:hypothetical protein
MSSTIDVLREVNARLKSPSLTIDERQDLERQRRDLEDDITHEFALECIAEGEHFRQITSVGGYDVCFNCGAKA